MAGFKTLNGSYRGLVILVRSYSKILWAYHYYNTHEEYLAHIEAWRWDDPAEWDALYCFNGEGVLKEQARYAKGTVFGRILGDIIRCDLIDQNY